MRLAVALLVAWLPAAVAGERVPAAEVSRHVGEARAVDGRLLYEEQHFVRRHEGRVQERMVLYRCPDGSPFARKHVRHDGVPERPEFSLYDARLGYREGFELDSVFVQRNGQAELRRAALRAGEGLVVDAGFDEFVRSRWDALTGGQVQRLHFLVPSRLGAHGFRVRRLREETIGDDAVSVFELSLGGLMGWFGDAIEVAYRDSDRRLMRFSGLTNIRSLSGRNLSATIMFPPEREAAVADADWQAAEREALQACRLGG